jgi:hypothetical protein
MAKVDISQSCPIQHALSKSSAGRRYVSAFLSFRDFKRSAAHIAWETEVWIGENPEHMLHYKGDRYLGSRLPQVSG